MNSSWVLPCLFLLAAANGFGQEAHEYYDIAYNSENRTTRLEYEASVEVDKSADGSISVMVNSFHDNGQLNESGMVFKGRKQGRWLRYSDLGVLISEAHYRKGKKHGAWKVWNHAGVLMLSIQYADGDRYGTWERFDDAGQLIDTMVY